MAKSDRRPPPAFQFYASDTLADEDFMFASMGERGLLISMMAYAWANGSVPRAPDLLARAIGSTDAEVRSALTERVLGQFEDCPTRPGFLEHLDLVRQRREMEHRARLKTDAAKAGASGRWGKSRRVGATSTEADSTASGIAAALRTQCDGTADAMRAEVIGDESSGGERKGEERAYSRERAETALEEFVREYDEAERRIENGEGLCAPRPIVSLVATRHPGRSR